MLILLFSVKWPDFFSVILYSNFESTCIVDDIAYSSIFKAISWRTNFRNEHILFASFVYNYSSMSFCSNFARKFIYQQSSFKDFQDCTSSKICFGCNPFLFLSEIALNVAFKACYLNFSHVSSIRKKYFFAHILLLKGVGKWKLP